MAIARDAGTDGGAWGTGSLTYSFSHTVTGSDPFLVVHASEDTSSHTISGCTYNGVAMTGATANPLSSPDGQKMYMFYLANPATGANNVEITVSSTSAQGAFQAASYTGVDSDPIDSQNSGTASAVNSITVSNTTTADNTWSVGACENGSGDMVAGSNTSIFLSNASGNRRIHDSNAAQTPAGSFGQTISRSSGTNNWAMIVLAIKPVGAGGAAEVITPRRMLMGIGI